MVASKLLLATAIIALVSTATAVAGGPPLKITAADQAKAVGALLRTSDFGAGWQGGRTKTASLGSPDCPGFNPKESDLTVSGHANGRFTFQQGAVEVDQDVQVLASAKAVKVDFARTISPALGRCLAHELSNSTGVTDVSVSRIPFPPSGAASAAFRAVISVQRKGEHGRVLSDFVYFGEGRLEYFLNVTAPIGAGDQLVRFESALAAILLKRAAAGTA